MRDSIFVSQAPSYSLLLCNLIRAQGGFSNSQLSPSAVPLYSFVFLSNTDPARVARMPRQTYLPAGMEGVIICPVQADPPVLYVNWTKDGNYLNLDNVSIE